MIRKIIHKIFPYAIIIALSIFVFSPFFFKNLTPIPSDITTGMYFPWLNYKWGNYVGVPVKNPLMSDIVSIIYEWRIFAINNLKNGIFPFWNPHYLFGMPLFANFQNSLINLTNIPFFFPLSAGKQWGLMIYLNLLFHMLTLYLFLKSQKFHPIPSIIGSITASLSLFSVVWLPYGVHNYTSAFLPLLLYFVQKFIDSKKINFLVFFCISLSLQIYGGYPQYAIYSIMLSSLFLLVKTGFRHLILLISFTTLGLLIALPIILPGYELINNSIHNIDNTSIQSNNGYLPIQNLITSLSPNFYGNPATYDYIGNGFYDNNAFYTGIFSLSALIFYFFNIKSLFKKNKTTLFFILLITISFVIAIKNPLSIFLKTNLSLLFSGNGISTRIFILSNLAFAYISAKYSQSIINKRSITYFLPLVIIILFQSYLIFSTSGVSSKNTIYSLILSLTILLILFLRHFVILKNKKIVSIFLLTTVFLDLYYVTQKYLPFTPEKYLFPPTPSIEFLKENSKNFRISTSDTIPQNMWMPYGLLSPDGYDTLMPLTSHKYLSLIESSKIDPSASRATRIKNFKSPLVDLIGVKYVLKQNTWDIDPIKFKKVFTEGQVDVYENLNSISRASLYFQNKIFTTEEEIVRELVKDSEKSLLILKNENQEAPLLPNCSPTKQSLQFIKDEPNQIILSTSSDCPSYLFLSDTYYPNWSAKVNGTTTPIYKSNLSFRSVHLPAGTNQITFNYQPTNFVFYTIVSLLTISILIIIIFKNAKVA